MAASKRTTSSTRGRTVRKQKQQRNLFLIGLVALVIIVIIGGVAAIGRQSTDAATTAASQPVNVFNGAAPANAEQNGRAWGPKDAPITVIEYADYECESCGYFATNYEKVLGLWE